MKVLFIRFSSIGDIVLTSPIVRCFRRKYPEAEIHFLVKEQFGDLVRYNPYIDQIHLFRGRLRDLKRELRAEQFDFIFDLQKSWRSRRIRAFLDVPAFSFPKLNLRKWIYVRFKWDLLPDKSVVERSFRAVGRLQVFPDHQGLDFFMPEEARIQEEDLPLGHLAGYIACVIGGSFSTKRFPVDKWQLFCRKISFPIVLLGGPEDARRGEEIMSANPAGVYNACGRFSLLESADIVRRARVVVTNDTGLMHIAAAFQKPIVSLWGNTTPKLGMFPYFGANGFQKNPSPKSILFEIKGLNCRPCSKIGFDKCPKGHFKCMRDLDVERICHAVKALWSSQSDLKVS